MKARAVAVVALVAALLVLSGDARGQEKKYDTPQAVFDAFKTAIANNDWKAVYHTVTPESGNALVAGLIVQGYQVQAFAAKDKTGKLAELAKPFEKAFARHSLSQEVIEKALKAIGKPKTTEEGQTALLKVAGLVKDRGAFLGDVMPLLTKGKKDLATAAKATLEDVKITGDKATGTVVTSVGGKDKREPLAFKKVGGGWRVEMPLSGGSRPAPKPADRPVPPPAPAPRER
jgi:hypothetical protein